MALALGFTTYAASASDLSYGEVCTQDGVRPAWVSPSSQFEGFVFPLNERWTETATDAGPLGQGDPTTVTWGVVPDGTFVPNFFGEPSADSDLETLLDGLYGSEGTWLPLFQEAFDNWEAMTGIDFVHEPNDDGEAITSVTNGLLGVRPDVRIAGKFIDGNGGGLAYGLFPQIGDIVLDSADSKYLDVSNSSFNLKQIVMHEIGHALGIFHVCPTTETKLMEPTFIDAFFGPQIDDLAAGQRGYGDAIEPNDSEATAYALGSLSTGDTAALRLLSIDDSSDLDFYSFSLSSTEEVTVSVVPMGQIYPSEGEQGGGGCDASAPNYDGIQVHDLKVQLLDSSSTVIATADVGGDGDSEQIEMNLAADTYTIEIQGNRSTDAIQLYGLWLTAEGYRIEPPTPRVAGAPSMITLQGASPGGQQFLVLGFGSGEDEIPVCVDDSDVSSIRLLTSATANGSGEVTFTFNPPASASGRTGFFQVVEQSTCEISNLITGTFE